MAELSQNVPRVFAWDRNAFVFGVEHGTPRCCRHGPPVSPQGRRSRLAGCEVARGRAASERGATCAPHATRTVPLPDGINIYLIPGVNVPLTRAWRACVVRVVALVYFSVRIYIRRLQD